MPNYQSLLRSYGFQPLDGVVIAGAEETGTYYDGLQKMCIRDRSMRSGKGPQRREAA